MLIDNIIFFYPSRIVGGAEFLFLRLARLLAESGRQVWYIDYPDGFARRQLADSKVNFLDYADNVRTVIKQNGYLITPLSNFYRLPDCLDIQNPELKLFFWSIHPYNVIHVFPEVWVLDRLPEKWLPFFIKNFCSHNRKIYGTLLKELDGHLAVRMMDGINYNLNQKVFAQHLNKEYLPILALDPQTKAKEIPAAEGQNNIAVVGRLCKEKVYPLLSVLDGICAKLPEQPVRIHIIGEGEAQSLIKPEKYRSKLELIFTGTLSNRDLHQYLTKNCNLVCAMGTSAVESAALEIPTVMIDFSYKPTKNDKFAYIFEYKNFEAGPQANFKTMPEILHEISDPGRKKEIGALCRQYYLTWHAPATVTDKLLSFLSVDTLTFKNYAQIRQKSGTLHKNRYPGYLIMKKWLKLLEKVKKQ